MKIFYELLKVCYFCLLTLDGPPILLNFSLNVHTYSRRNIAKRLAIFVQLELDVIFFSWKYGGILI